MWPDRLPASVAFCDVETTGLGNHDRIVSFGGIGMFSRTLAKGGPDLEYLYLVFDPGRENHHGAEQMHGFSDSTLRLQEPFAVHAAEISRFLTSHELLVAHNAAFDIRFINREMRLSGLPALTSPVYCTMKGYRALDRGGSASLSAVCQPHQARSCWPSARRDRGRLARDADLSLAARLPASASIASLASSHPIQLASPCDRRIPCRQTGTRPVPTFVKRADRLSIHGIIFVSSPWPRRKRFSERGLQPDHRSRVQVSCTQGSKMLGSP